MQCFFLHLDRVLSARIFGDFAVLIRVRAKHEGTRDAVEPYSLRFPDPVVVSLHITWQLGNLRRSESTLMRVFGNHLFGRLHFYSVYLKHSSSSVRL